MSKMNSRCGFIAILGRPNVGKSTLLNRLVKHKISITTSRAQTTRHRIIGIVTEQNRQYIFVDTPGLHQTSHSAINKRMNKIALNVMHEVDVIVWVLEADRFKPADKWIVAELKKINLPIIAVINKIDKLKDKSRLLPQIDALDKQIGLQAVLPLSAKKAGDFQQLKNEIGQRLPEVDHFLYPEHMLTDRPSQFRAAEFIREKLTTHLHDELPFSINVEIERFDEQNDRIEIHAMIWVARDSQKAIVIGDKGERMKLIATQARLAIEQHLQKKVDLRCWVKTKADWMNDEKQLDLWGFVHD